MATTSNVQLENDKKGIRTTSWTTDNNFIISDSEGKSFLEDLYQNGLEYTADSKIDITVGDRGVYINDGVNPIHMIKVLYQKRDRKAIHLLHQTL